MPCLLALLLAIAASGGALGQSRNSRNHPNPEILVPEKSWELLGKGYHLTADSAVDFAGNVYFTDARRNRILKVDLDGRISTWKESSNGAHGIAFGPDGRFYAGQHDLKRIVAFGSDGAESVVVQGVSTHHLTVTARNEIYFTEPPAHRVWIADFAGNKRSVFEGIHWPRSVRASADRTRLFVNDPPTPWVWTFAIQPDGSVKDGRKFCRLEADKGSTETDSGGMALDAQDFLYVATKNGVQVCDPRGQVVSILEVPPGENGVSNVLFAGPDLAWLYVNDWENIYRRPAKRRGVVLPKLP